MFFPSDAGELRTQLPFLDAKKGTFIAPPHEVSQICLPESRSKALTISFFFERVSTVRMRLPLTIGDE